ncbi:uncharacterized protein [Rutidosis leptorrhynchoides]|uniref:uncharacterized protein n=1 Tax=Rutidosis leptorrhynchoides TaxID=125765 RepID=UPI003A9993AF
MTGVPREVAEHRLNVNPNIHPVCQKKRGMEPERSKFLRDEVRSLVDAGILREVKYQTWVANPVMDQIGRNLEAYVDDIVIKSHTEEKMLRDIQETFVSLRKINMKLNPKKCTFGVEEGKFLGHIVTERGIKANPKKIQAIEEMKSPASRKDVQRLHGCLAALTRFLSKAAEKSLPFMKVLKSCLNKKDFVWTAEAESAFQEVKQLLKTLPTLTAPKEGETLILYLAVSKEAQILRRPESSDHLAKWAIELGEYEINFAPRNAVKGQILEDFLLETNEKVEYDNKMAPQQHVWELQTDGASSEEGTEYEALLSGLRLAVEMGITNLRAYVDSQIVAQQVNGTFDARDTSMRNKKADILSKLATLTFDHLHKRVLIEELKEKSIHEKPIMAIVESAMETWMTPYLRYLHDGGLPIDKTEARMIRVTAPMYEIVNGALYQKSYNVQRLPKYDLIPVSSAWPFCKWAINIVGPFNRSTANGQVEVTNKEIVAGIKARLGLSQTGWVDELPNVLWAHRTTPKRSTGETPFSLVYGTEAVIPAEICVPTQRIMAFDIEANSEALRENLNLLEERRLKGD